MVQRLRRATVDLDADLLRDPFEATEMIDEGRVDHHRRRITDVRPAVRDEIARRARRLAVVGRRSIVRVERVRARGMSLRRRSTCGERKREKERSFFHSWMCK